MNHRRECKTQNGKEREAKAEKKKGENLKKQYELERHPVGNGLNALLSDQSAL